MNTVKLLAAKQSEVVGADGEQNKAKKSEH